MFIPLHIKTQISPRRRGHQRVARDDRPVPEVRPAGGEPRHRQGPGVRVPAERGGVRQSELHAEGCEQPG